MRTERQGDEQADMTKLIVSRPLPPAQGPNTLLSNSLLPVHAMAAYQGTRTAIFILQTSVPNGVDWPASRSGRFNPGETDLDMLLIGAWTSPTAGVDVALEKR